MRPLFPNTLTIHDGEIEFLSRRGVFEATLCDRFVSDLRRVGGFLRVLRFPRQYN